LSKKVNLSEKLSSFSETYHPHVVADFNGHDVMVVKAEGPFVWHSHDDTDDFFLVLSGRLLMRLREEEIELGPGELFVVPKGVEHCPEALEETHLLIIEPKDTPNTGDSKTAVSKPRI
jgi:mannose-6-phosphate isomerase-like protein (cupin superfamily)